MVKKILKIFGGLLGAIIVLIIIASIAVIFIVNKDLVEKQMEKALNRHVQIEDISVGIFSVVSGIEVKNAKISNFKTEQQLKALHGKPVSPGDIFVDVRSIKLKLKFMPLLKKQFELNQLVLYGPKINVVKSKAGGFNFDDLLKPKKLTAEEKAELEKEKAEEAKKPKKEFTVDDIPVAISIGKVGIEDGTLTYVDQTYGQTFQVYNLTALVYSISIDPKNIEKKNNVKIKLAMGVKTMGQMKSGSVKSFDIKFDINGNMKPFNARTKKIDPEITLKMGSPEGMISGLQIFEKVAENKKLNEFLGKHLSFLKGTQKWKGSKAAYVNVYYRGGTAKLTDGRVNAEDAVILFDGQTNINTKSLNVNLVLELADKHNKTAINSVRDQVQSGLKKLGIDKYANPDKVALAALKPFLNERAKIYMKFIATGTLSSPNVEMTNPKVGSLSDVIKSVVGDVAKDAAKEAAKDAANKAIKDGSKQLLKKIKIF